ncbi:hypothetical protein M0R45_030939 [Rubus argutus]|uniref:Uncharacterized protein n=1 Tax=Rubus argutus TaxID=59490 RepID=A0AAW1WCM3_RUBAR
MLLSALQSNEEEQISCRRRSNPEPRFSAPPAPVPCPLQYREQPKPQHRPCFAQPSLASCLSAVISDQR